MRADLVDRADTGRVLVSLDDIVNCTGPVDRGEPSADLNEGAPTDSVQDCVIFAARRRLIGRLGSVDLILLFFGGGSEAAEMTREGRRRDPEPAEPSGYGSRRDRGRPRDTSVVSPCLTAKAIHLCFSVRKGRSQPSQLHYNSLMLSEVALV